MDGIVAFLIALAGVLSLAVAGWAARYRLEAVMNALAALALILVMAVLAFTIWHAEASGPLIISVLFAGFVGMLLMLWNHWTEGRTGPRIR